jgi:CoA:oxalate CoA-transferase
VVARGETVRLEHPEKQGATDVYGPGLPIVFSGAKVGFDQPPPGLGEHNQDIYCDLLGYSPGELDLLRAEGAI